MTHTARQWSDLGAIKRSTLKEKINFWILMIYIEKINTMLHMYVYAAVVAGFFSPPSSSLACTIWNCSFQSRLLKYQNWHKSVRILWFGVRLLGRPPWRGGCPSQLIDNSGTLGPNLPPALTPHAKSPQFVYLLFGNSLVVSNLCLSNIIHHYAKEGPPKSHNQPTTTKIWSAKTEEKNDAEGLGY